MLNLSNNNVSSVTSTIEAKIIKKPISQIVVAPQTPRVCEENTIELDATAFDSDNKKVEVSPDRWTWTNSTPANLNLVTNGNKAMVKGIKAGNGEVKVLEKVSGKQLTVPLAVTQNFCRKDSMDVNANMYFSGTQFGTQKSWIVNILGGIPPYKVAAKSTCFDYGTTVAIQDGCCKGFRLEEVVSCTNRNILMIVVTDSRGQSKSVSLGLL